MSSNCSVSFHMTSVRLPLLAYSQHTQIFGGSMQAPTKELILLWFNTSTCKPKSSDITNSQFSWLGFHVIKVKALTTTHSTAETAVFSDLSHFLQQRAVDVDFVFAYLLHGERGAAVLTHRDVQLPVHGVRPHQRRLRVAPVQHLTLRS